MPNRRHFLLTAAGAAALAGSFARAQTPAAAPAANPEAAKLSAFFEKVFQEELVESPQLVTQLGLHGMPGLGDGKSRLDDASLADLADDKARARRQLGELQAIDRSRLSGMAAVNYDAVYFIAETGVAANERFPYGSGGAGGPYVVSQLTGSYQNVPDFLGSQHTIETKADADAYLARLADFGRVLDEETAHVRHDFGLGVVPPDFVIERTLTQMQGLVTDPAANPMVTSVAGRTQEKGIAGDYAAQAAKIYADTVLPALERQMAVFKAAQPTAVHDAGVWRLPDGEAYYAASLLGSTTTKMSADEIHQTGLEQARILSERADVLLKGQGLTQGTVGERIRALYKDPKHHYPNTDEAKEQMLVDLNAQTQAMWKRLPEAFATMPKAPVEIRRVPKFIEAGAPGGYYNQPTLDGSRPGIFWINLRDTAEYPKWTLNTLTMHEAVPGHHMQLALQQEADLPMIRRAIVLSAYAEGWALYAEELAKEMGVYEDDPLGEIGYLQAALFRSARLVVDTGLHAKRWSREKAIETMSSIDGSPTTAATTEIERYCVWPGQACSYMVGKLTFLRLRQKAKAALGDRFDIKAFHDAVLLVGAVPLTVLETVVDNMIAQARA